MEGLKETTPGRDRVRPGANGRSRDGVHFRRPHDDQEVAADAKCEVPPFEIPSPADTANPLDLIDLVCFGSDAADQASATSNAELVAFNDPRRRY
jgi:hypothetical protein